MGSKIVEGFNIGFRTQHVALQGFALNCPIDKSNGGTEVSLYAIFYENKK